MSCSSCYSKFSLFTKEHQCPGCMMSFCTKCLKDKVSNKNKLLCSTCKTNLPVKSLDDDLDPPAVLLKRLETLENPAKPPVTMIRPNTKLENLKRGLSKEDMVIVERLEKLKEKREIVPSEQEIFKRLKLLKGEGNTEVSTSKITLQTVPKTNVEQVDDLLMQYMEEVNLDGTTAPNLAEEMEARLASLKGQTYGDDRKMVDSEPEDESVAIANIIKRAQEEAALPATGELSPVDISPPNELDPELPWCELCNGDATVCCISCDNALYCQRCLKESHDRDEYIEHKTKPYQNKTQLA